MLIWDACKHFRSFPPFKFCAEMDKSTTFVTALSMWKMGQSTLNSHMKSYLLLYKIVSIQKWPTFKNWSGCKIIGNGVSMVVFNLVIISKSHLVSLQWSKSSFWGFFISGVRHKGFSWINECKVIFTSIYFYEMPLM